MKRIALALLIAALPTQSLSKGDTYICALSSGTDGWIADEVIIEDKNRNGARIHDEIVQQFNGGPVDATLEGESSKKWVVSWSVPTRDARGQVAQMRYRAAITKPSGRAIVTAKPSGYSSRFIARGECRQYQ